MMKRQKQLLMSVLMYVMIACLLMFLLVTWGCTSDGCEHLETRCKGQVAQVCDDASNWSDSMDCSAIEPLELNWTCCFVSDDDLNEWTCEVEEFCDEK